MECSNPCRFCSIFEGEYTYEKVDRPIFEDEEFALISSIGALIEGWVLIVPKIHCYSMREFYGDIKFNSFLNKSVKLLEKTYSKKVIAFEHGANGYNSLTSCGTNHAHLHLLPLNDSLIERIKDDFKWSIVDLNDRLPINKEDEYLLYSEIRESNNETYLHVLEQPKSQYFRRLVAEKIKRPDEYNYKEYLLLDNAIVTNSKLSSEV